MHTCMCCLDVFQALGLYMYARARIPDTWVLCMCPGHVDSLQACIRMCVDMTWALYACVHVRVLDTYVIMCTCMCCLGVCSRHLGSTRMHVPVVHAQW